MTQEYVVVEDPYAPRERPRDGSSSPMRRARAALITVTALALVAMGAVLVWPDGEEAPAPDLVPEPTTANAAKASAVVYQEWRDRSALVECLRERGFPYEARIVDRTESLAVVAQFLGQEPATAHPDAPVPMLRQPDLYLGRGGALDEGVLPEGGPCALSRTAIDIDDADTVDRAVAAAREDDAFLVTLAEQVWVEQHPAEVTHEISLLRHDRSSTDGEPAPDGWESVLEVVAGVAQDRTVWVPVVRGSEDSFAQAVGLTESGKAVAVRVSGDGVMLDRGTYMTRSDAIRCGPVTISAGVKGPWGDEADLADIMDALGPACNALIGSGIVEGESLADVYWD